MTLATSATDGGLSLTDQILAFRAGTNAQTGYITAEQVTAIETNTAKVGTFYIDARNYLTNTVGTVNQSTELTAALSAATGGTLCFPDGIRAYISSSVTVPARTRILGECGKGADPFDDSESAIVIGSSAVLSMGIGCTIDKMKAIAKATYDTSSASNPESIFAGTGIRLTNADITIRDCSIYGFETGVATYSTNLTPRLLMEDVSMDNSNGVLLFNSHDTSRLMNVSCWPHIYDASHLTRTGEAFRLGDGTSTRTVEYTELRGCMSYGYAYGVYLDEAGHVSVASFGVWV